MTSPGTAVQAADLGPADQQPLLPDDRHPHVRLQRARRRRTRRRALRAHQHRTGTGDPRREDVHPANLEFEDGLLVEETFDYFAQDKDGNVWYLGEDVTKFEYDEDGNLIGTSMEGAWRAGENSALPGFIMPADLTIGFNYFQEHAPAADALDQGTIYMLMLDIGEFENVLQILETTEIEPDSKEFKYYAPGVGLILVEEDLDEDLANSELVFELTQIRSVPEPRTAGLLLAGLLTGASLRLRRRRLRQH